MPIVTIAAGKERVIQTPAKYLSVIGANGQFVVNAPALGNVIGKIGRQYVLDNITEVLFINDSGDPIEIEYEIANIQIFGSGSGSVSIENKPTIRRIEEAIQVNAAATVENGTVTAQSHDSLIDFDDITIPPGTKIKIIDAEAVNRRTVIMQVISSVTTRLRIGSNTVTAGRGLVLEGSTDAIASLEFEAITDIYAYNESPDDAVVSLIAGVK
ncbi:hypothetical protein [Aestuariibacter sp. A3R04]|uniref:hypothetical protein n=1 Tax=Aestuariibacter sp. A3R04 TaxID=2841571 RepID=UPI001C09CC4F|nr:hypothetical protein [Aestuariibacter sp. A3R04]MBU3022879.1 hypothetical protein [Aestuariibacter sp. A3R04]